MVDKPETKRLTSLDAFRGLTIAGMILVNNPGDWSHVYRPLLHAEWNGWTPTDWIFPFFLFIMGVAMALSLRVRIETADRKAVWIKIIRRTVILFGLGFVLSAYPRFDLANVRIMGVLERIALCYLAVSAIMVLLPRNRDQWLVMGGLIGVYLLIMYGLNVPGYGRGVLTPEGHAGGYIDRLILGEQHLWRGTKIYDPEGLVTTLPAILTTFLGLQFGKVIVRYKEHQDRVFHWLLLGAILLITGILLDYLIPINKQLWTPSYSIFMAGLGGLFLGICYWLIEIKGRVKWSAPFVMLGMNPLIIFWFSGFMVRNLSLLKISTETGKTSVLRWLYAQGYASWLPDYPASLAFALTNVAFWLLVAWFMYRRRWFVKI